MKRRKSREGASKVSRRLDRILYNVLQAYIRKEKKLKSTTAEKVENEVHEIKSVLRWYVEKFDTLALDIGTTRYE